MIAILFVVIRLVSIVDANFVQLQRTFLNVIQDLNKERASLTETQVEQHHAFIHVLDKFNPKFLNERRVWKKDIDRKQRTLNIPSAPSLRSVA